jgi:tRNA(Ile)-lysidine synthetase-like protein
VLHLDHELRGAESDGDGEFVRRLAGTLKLPLELARRSEIEPSMRELPSNPSARYRAVRLELFRRVVDGNKLDGVILAHHADDQAETVLQRLIRGSPPAGLAGMAADQTIDGLRIVRPLLTIRREQLRAFLAVQQQQWREDASNQADDYLRNRLRKMLAVLPELTDGLLELSASCRALNDWVHRNAPQLPPVFSTADLAALPTILAAHSAKNWLVERGCPAEDLSGEVVDRLVSMAADAATPHAQEFPGKLTVRRRGGQIFPSRRQILNR